MRGWATARFHNLPADKMARVLDAALNEFSTHGYRNANTNRIAEEAGISVGALFKYFATKEDLFRHLVAVGVEQIEHGVSTILDGPGGLLDKLEAILRLVLETSRTRPELVALYQEITTAGNRELVHELALRVERYTSAAYTELIRQAQERGEVRADVDPGLLAFCLDNLFMSLQFSLACDYYQDRMELYVPTIDDDTLVAQMLAVVSGAVAHPAVLPRSRTENQP